MKINKNDYGKMAQAASPPSPLAKNMVMAFLIGGAICVIGQLISDYYKSLELEKDTVSGMTSFTLVFLSALFTGLGLYDKLAKYAGAGTLVPITGFANAVVAPAIEFRAEGFIAGMSAKMFLVAGPVIVYGTVCSVAAGIIYFFIR